MDLILPRMERTWIDASRFAIHAHAGQTDKSGRPYYEHVSRVAQRVVVPSHVYGSERIRLADNLRQVAYLHDILEDTAYNDAHLRAEGFSREVVSAVDELTRRRGDPLTYIDWIASIAAHGSLYAVIVKHADVGDNSDPRRLSALDAENRDWLNKKYGPASTILEQALRDRGVINDRDGSGSGLITDFPSKSRADHPDLPALRPDEKCTIARRRSGLDAPRSGCIVPGCISGGMLGCPYESEGSRHV